MEIKISLRAIRVGIILAIGLTILILVISDMQF